jgi:hypothetical protein
MAIKRPSSVILVVSNSKKPLGNTQPGTKLELVGAQCANASEQRPKISAASGGTSIYLAVFKTDVPCQLS